MITFKTYSKGNEHALFNEGVATVEEKKEYMMRSDKSTTSTLCVFISCAFLLLIGCDDHPVTNGPATKALWNAAEAGDIEGAKRAIENGATIEARNHSLSVKGSWTTLMRVIYDQGNKDMVKFLIEAGADVNAKSHYGATPLSLAAEKGHLEITKVLLSHGADINAKDDHGDTALMYAVEFGHPDAVKLLLDSGSDVTPKDADGETALMVAKRRNDRNIQTLLITAGAKE